METELVLYISVGVLAAAWFLLLVFTVYLYCQHRRLRKRFEEMSSVSKFRVQKLKMQSDSKHAYQNPGIAPGEELSRRGYSMYSGEPDLESNHSQASGPFFIEDMNERNQRQAPANFAEDAPRNVRQQPGYADDVVLRNQRQPPTNAPPFLLNAIETNKRKSLSNPVSANHASRHTNVRNTNPNFIY